MVKSHDEINGDQYNVYKCCCRSKGNKTYNNKPENLLIIGNGFDLYCQLKSDFTEFLRNVINNNVKKTKNLVNFKEFYTFIDRNMAGITASEQLALFAELKSHADFRKLRHNLNGKNFKLVFDITQYNDIDKYVLLISGTLKRYYDDLFLNNNAEDPTQLNKDINVHDYIHSEIFNLMIYSREALYDYPDANERHISSLDNCFFKLLYGRNIPRVNEYKNHNNNFWVLYFELLLSMNCWNYMPENSKYNISNWADIEHNLMIYLTRYSKDVYIYLTYIACHMDHIPGDDNHYLGNLLFTRFFSNIRDNNGSEINLTFKERIHYFLIINFSAIFLISCGIFKINDKPNSDLSADSSKTPNHILAFWQIDNEKAKRYYYNFLADQLHKFEDIFSSYMSNMSKNI